MINTDKSSNTLAGDVKDLSRLKEAAKLNSPEALRETAKKFEALFINMVLKSMRDATPKEGMFDSEHGKMFGSMLDQQLSQSMSNRGVGLADVLVKQLSNNSVKNATVENAAASLGPSATQKKSSVDPALKDPSTTVQLEKIQSTVRSAYSTQQAPHIAEFKQKMSAGALAASEKTGIPSEFILAQAALESGWGKREIKNGDGSTSYNVFGIKAGPGWKGKTTDVATTEYRDGHPQKIIQKFRSYDNYADAFSDYANLLKNNGRYDKVIASSATAIDFAHGMQKAGYATDPRYAEKLTRLINATFLV